MTQFDGVHGRIKREYIDVIIEHVLRSQRFSHISNVRKSPELISNNPVVSSRRTTLDEVVIRQANVEPIQQSRDWQHDLKSQKDEIIRTLLCGSREEISTV